MKPTTPTNDTNRTMTIDPAPEIRGLRFRPFAVERDIAALSELIAESNLADGIDWIPTPASLAADLEHRPNFEPGRDILLAEIDDLLVGAIEHGARERASGVAHHLEGWVRPEHRRRGMGRALLRWGEARAREAAASWPGDASHVAVGWPDEQVTGAIALFEAEGYETVRYGFMMIRPLDEPIPAAPLPAGLDIRPVRAADHRRIWDADVEAFRDHWDAAVRTDEDFAAWFASPDLDTSLWRVAWDGDEVSGSVMNFVYPEENERLGIERGWLEHVSVRRPWRRRGLAAALIADSLRALRDRGLAEAALVVDAENPTGALRLYESLGFRRHRTGVQYRKIL